MEKLGLEPDAGVPPVAVHANMYGVVPPVAEAVHVTAVPTVPVAGQLIDVTSVKGATVTVWDALPVTGGVDVSVTVNATVKVPLVV